MRDQVSGTQIVEKILSDKSTVFDVVWIDDVTAVQLTFACVSRDQAHQLKAILDAITILVDAP